MPLGTQQTGGASAPAPNLVLPPRSVDASQEIAPPPRNHDNRGGRVLLTFLRVFGHVTKPQGQSRDQGWVPGLSGMPGFGSFPHLSFPSEGSCGMSARDGVGEDGPWKCVGQACPERGSGLRGQRLPGLGLGHLALAFQLTAWHSAQGPQLQIRPRTKAEGSREGPHPWRGGRSSGPEDCWSQEVQLPPANPGARQSLHQAPVGWVTGTDSPPGGAEDPEEERPPWERRGSWLTQPGDRQDPELGRRAAGAPEPGPQTQGAWISDKGSELTSKEQRVSPAPGVGTTG